MKGYEWMQKQKLSENEDRRQQEEHLLRLEQLRQHLEDSGLLRKEKGRDEAIANAQMLKGTDPRDAPFTSIEGPGGGPAEFPITPEASRPREQFNAQTGETDTIPEVGAGNRFRPVPIPNVYNEGSVDVRPRSRREMNQAAEDAAAAKADAAEYNLNPGQARFRGRQKIASVPLKPERTTDQIFADENARQRAIAANRPPRASAKAGADPSERAYNRAVDNYLRDNPDDNEGAFEAGNAAYEADQSARQRRGRPQPASNAGAPPPDLELPPGMTGQDQVGDIPLGVSQPRAPVRRPAPPVPLRPMAAAPLSPAPTAQTTPPQAPGRPNAPQFAIGQEVTLKGGQKARVTKVYPDGTFDADPVR
jgi:hypothetical protein